MTKVTSFDEDGAENKLDDEIGGLTQSTKIKPVPSEEASLLYNIVDDIFFSGSMPKLMKFIHNYDFYPLDVDPKELSIWEHAKIYSRHIPFLCLYYANIILRGIGQVYICNHPITGLCVCAGLYLSSPTLLAYAILGTVYENIGAFLFCSPPIGEMEAGLFGYDGALVGCAVYSFLSLDPYTQITPSLTNRGMLILMVLGIAVGVFHSSCVNMNKLPALTLAFNMLTMTFILALARRNATVATLGWLLVGTEPSAPTAVHSTWDDMSGSFVLDALFRGVGQFCFVGTTAGGVLVVLGIFICSRRASYMALAGSLTAMVFCMWVLLLPIPAHSVIRNGIYGYNAVGTCVAVGGNIFFKVSLPNTIVAIAAAALTVLVQVAIQSVLNTDGLGLPVLTCPFVLTAWLVMLSRSHWLEPVTAAGEDLDDALQLERLRDEDAWWHRPQRQVVCNESPERRQRRELLVKMKSSSQIINIAEAGGSVKAGTLSKAGSAILMQTPDPKVTSSALFANLSGKLGMSGKQVPPKTLPLQPTGSFKTGSFKSGKEGDVGATMPGIMAGGVSGRGAHYSTRDMVLEEEVEDLEQGDFDREPS